MGCDSGCDSCLGCVSCQSCNIVCNGTCNTCNGNCNNRCYGSQGGSVCSARCYMFYALDTEIACGNATRYGYPGQVMNP
jgi:hypothetical protein